jgi:sialate O-acetylesterase
VRFRRFTTVLLLAGSLHASVNLPRLFGHDMLLPLDLPLPVWGTASPGESVAVAFAGQDKSATTGAGGKWRVTPDPIAADKTPRNFTVRGANELVMTNVVVGEVWLCSGQSNMEWVVDNTANFEAEKAAADFPDIRHCKVPRAMSAFPRADLGGSWEICSPKTAGAFSAVGFYFARKLLAELGVPIGLLHTSWGETPIEAWVDPKTVAAVPEWAELQGKLHAASPASPEGLARHKQSLEDLEKWTAGAEAALAEGNPLSGPPQIKNRLQIR